jgi:hypothetical protein
MSDLKDDLRLIRDLSVKREMDSGNYRWFGKEAAELTKERGFPILGLILFFLVLSTEWEIEKIVAFSFWVVVALVSMYALVSLFYNTIWFISDRPALVRVLKYSFTAWVLFNLIRFHF